MVIYFMGCAKRLDCFYSNWNDAPSLKLLVLLNALVHTRTTYFHADKCQPKSMYVYASLAKPAPVSGACTKP